MISMIRLVERHCVIALFALAVVVVLASTSAQAGLRWCYTDHPDAVFCDGFDRYCTLPPADPNYACASPDGCTKANWLALEVWMPIACGARINLDEGGDCGGGAAVSWPFGAKYPKGDQGHHNVSLGAYAQSKYGGSVNAVKATDEDPLILEFAVTGGTGPRLAHADAYIELALVDAVNFIDHRAPTNYIFDDLCYYPEHEVDINHPMICQQDVPPVGCPDIATAPHHSSIAVGVVAYLDKEPCVSSSDYLPTNNHLAVFDGYKWWTLPASFTGSGDFILGDGFNSIRLTLWETTMKVELTHGGSYSWCEMTRDYQGGDSEGAFNKLSLGFGMACLIDQGSWTCAGTPGTDRIYQCIPTVSYSKLHYYYVGPVFDSVVLEGGEPHTLPMPIGACCMATGQCVNGLTEYECETVNGGDWQQMGTNCASLICCVDPFADADGDGDVDSTDFGMFQACYTGPGPVTPVPSGQCTCFDRDFWGWGDDDVDADDYAAFEACLSGPTVPTDPACDD